MNGFKINENSYLSNCSAGMLFNNKLSPSELRVWLCLRYLFEMNVNIKTNKDKCVYGILFFSQAKIADICGIGERQVRRCISVLKENKFLYTKKCYNSSNFYIPVDVWAKEKELIKIGMSLNTEFEDKMTVSQLIAIRKKQK